MVHGRRFSGVTDRLELMVAVRPTFHPPALLAKQAANIDHISGGRLSLNVVSSWWARRRSNTEWSSTRTTRATGGRRMARGRRRSSGPSGDSVSREVLQPGERHPRAETGAGSQRPTSYGRGESAAKALIARSCDG